MGVGVQTESVRSGPSDILPRKINFHQKYDSCTHLLREKVVEQQVPTRQMRTHVTSQHPSLSQNIELVHD